MWKKRRMLMDQIIQSVFEAVDPYTAVKKSLILVGDTLIVGQHRYLLKDYRKIVLIGFGKAVGKMASGALSVLGEQVKEGLIIAKHTSSEEKNTLPVGITLLRGNHPVPGDDSFFSSKALLKQVANLDQRDLVICLISGGGSALCSAPEEGILAGDVQEMTQALLACGAEINEMNVLRKHVDAIKGGGLAARIAPATLVTLILSDVIGSPLDVIASGPTVADASTFGDMASIVAKYQLDDKLPASILDRLQQGLAGLIQDTPKQDDPVFQTVQNVLLSSNWAACQAAVKTTRDMGLNAQLLTTYLRGEAREAGRFLAGILQQIDQSGDPLPRPACIVLGGETTVTLQGDGLGGRNQELALAAVRDLAGVPNVLLFSLATDGEDGPTDAAGAWVDGETLGKGLVLGMNPDDYLARNDAYHYFQTLDQLVLTGPSGTNVNDCAFLLAFEKSDTVPM